VVLALVVVAVVLVLSSDAGSDTPAGVDEAGAEIARVIATAGSPEKLQLCRDLGADLALNYRTDDVPALLKEFAPEGIDLWFETQREPNLEVAIPLLRRRGRMINVGVDAWGGYPVAETHLATLISEGKHALRPLPWNIHNQH